MTCRKFLAAAANGRTKVPMYPETAKMIPSFALPFYKRPTAVATTADELQRRYLTAVLNYVTARLGSGPEAEDVTAEVFVAAFAALDRCPATVEGGDHDPARAYLFGIARRKLADVYRRRERHPEEALPLDMLAPVGNGPESGLLAGEAARTLRGLLAELPELQAEVLRLKYVEELSLIEIGLIVGKSAGAVGQLLHRARENARRRGAGYFAADFATEGTGDGC